MSRRGAARSARGSKGLRPYARDARYPLDSESGSGHGEEVGSGQRKPQPGGAAARFDFVPSPALGRPVVQLAQTFFRQGLSSAEVCSLFTHAAAVLAQQDDGFGREEWLELCADLHGQDATEEFVITSPGGLS